MKRFCLLLCLAIVLAGCEKKKNYDWTVFVYMAADNGLSENADADINEMEASDLPSGVKVVALVDRNAWAQDSDAVLYEISSDDDTLHIGSSLVSRYGELNTADPATLSERANDVFDRWPSDKRALFVWGHGNAWYRADGLKSVCDDSQSIDYMSVSDGELRDAMLGVSGGVDLLCFDACLMQTAEALSEVSDRADCIVASLDKTSVDGLPYKDILSSWNADAAPEEIADRIATLAANSYRFGGSQFDPGVTHTAFSSAHMQLWDDALAAVAAFAEAARQTADTDALHTAREETATFNDGEEMVDLAEYLAQVADATVDDTLGDAASQAAAALATAIPVADHFGYTDGTTGRVSVWLPVNAGGFVNWAEVYGAMRWSSTTGWAEFLSAYYAALQ